MIALILAVATTLGSMPCMEDQPCFNSYTMGNHQHGYLMPDGSRVIVGPKFTNK